VLGAEFFAAGRACIVDEAGLAGGAGKFGRLERLGGDGSTASDEAEPDLASCMMGAQCVRPSGTILGPPLVLAIPARRPDRRELI
jgi:hypothetical protein